MAHEIRPAWTPGSVDVPARVSCATCQRRLTWRTTPEPAADGRLVEWAHVRGTQRLTRPELDMLTERVAKLNKRASRHQLAGGILTLTSTPVEVERRDPVLGVRKVRMYDATVTGEPPRAGGWTFVATLDFDKHAGLVVRTAPGADDIDRSQVREGWCDHCRTNRRRSRIYAMRHTDGREMQVGSACIRDFLGHSVPWLMTVDDEDSLWSDLGYGPGRDVPTEFRVEEVAAFAVATVRAFGRYISKAGAVADPPTAECVNLLLYPPRPTAPRTEREWHRELEDMVCEHADGADTEADEVIAWARSDEFAGDSAYVDNLKAVVEADWVSDRNVNLLVSVVAAYRRHTQQQGRAAKINEHVGAEGDKLSVTVNVQRSIDIEHAYGWTTLYLMEDPEGRAFKWFASRPVLDDGATVTLKGTVKGHDEYEGRKATVLTRCKVVQAA